jgi:hypothetical protein
LAPSPLGSAKGSISSLASCEAFAFLDMANSAALKRAAGSAGAN